MDGCSSQSTLLPGDSPARTSPKRASGPGSRELARAFGLSMPVLLGSFDPDTCLLRTSQGCLFQEQCQEWSDIWPDAGMWESGSVSELLILEPPICVNECSLWPTAVTTDGASAARRTTTTGVSHTGTTLSDAISQWGRWPTPTEDNANNAGGPSRQANTYQDLTVEAIHWQTPGTDSFRCRGGERKDEMGLDQQARYFPSPAARDHRTPNKLPYSERGGGTKGEQLQNFVAHSLPAPATPDGEQSLPNAPISRRLSPRFVEWLMGFPIGWSEL